MDNTPFADLAAIDDQLAAKDNPDSWPASWLEDPFKCDSEAEIGQQRSLLKLNLS